MSPRTKFLLLPLCHLQAPKPIPCNSVHMVSSIKHFIHDIPFFPPPFLLRFTCIESISYVSFFKKYIQELTSSEEMNGENTSKKVVTNSSSSSSTKCCADCKTTRTPLWRVGPSGPKVNLCPLAPSSFIRFWVTLFSGSFFCSVLFTADLID